MDNKIKDLLTDDYLLSRGWLIRNDDYSKGGIRVYRVYEKKDTNYWLAIDWDHSLKDDIPHVCFIPIDPSLSGRGEHMPKGNTYIRTLEEFEVLERIIQYVPEDY